MQAHPELRAPGRPGRGSPAGCCTVPSSVDWVIDTTPGCARCVSPQPQACRADELGGELAVGRRRGQQFEAADALRGAVLIGVDVGAVRAHHRSPPRQHRLQGQHASPVPLNTGYPTAAGRPNCLRLRTSSEPRSPIRRRRRPPGARRSASARRGPAPRGGHPRSCRRRSRVGRRRGSCHRVSSDDGRPQAQAERLGHDPTRSEEDDGAPVRRRRGRVRRPGRDPQRAGRPELERVAAGAARHADRHADPHGLPADHPVPAAVRRPRRLPDRPSTWSW